MILCAFPGTGKTHLFNNPGSLDVVDSDSSTFDKGSYWPGNYCRHLIEGSASGSMMLASTHQEVRDTLVQAAENDEPGLRLVLVYPSREQQNEYLSRYIARGSPVAFVDLMTARWDSFIDELESQQGFIHVVLQPGQFITDRLDEIIGV